MPSPSPSPTAHSHHHVPPQSACAEGQAPTHNISHHPRLSAAATVPDPTRPPVECWRARRPRRPSRRSSAAAWSWPRWRLSRCTDVQQCNLYIQVGPFSCADGQGMTRPSLADAPPQGDSHARRRRRRHCHSAWPCKQRNPGPPQLSDRTRSACCSGRSRQRQVTGRARASAVGLRAVERDRNRRRLVGSRRPCRGRSSGRDQRGGRHLDGQDPDHATFTSKGGLTVQLVRHEGEKVPAALPVGSLPAGAR